MRWVCVMSIGMIGALCACDSQTPGVQPVPYESTAQIAPSGVSQFMFRSYEMQGGARQEVEGVPCAMRGEGFRSRFSTPAKLTAPVFGPATKPLTITCREGARAQAIAVKPFNKTQRDANKSLVHLTSATSVTGAVVAAAKIGTAMKPRDKAQDIYNYADTRIVLNPE